MRDRIKTAQLGYLEAHLRGQEERENCIAILYFTFIPQTEGFNFQNRLSFLFLTSFVFNNNNNNNKRGTVNYFTFSFWRNGGLGGGGWCLFVCVLCVCGFGFGLFVFCFGLGFFSVVLASLLQNANIFSLSYTPTPSKIMLEQASNAFWMKVLFSHTAKMSYIAPAQMMFPLFYETGRQPKFYSISGGADSFHTPLPGTTCFTDLGVPLR